MEFEEYIEVSAYFDRRGGLYKIGDKCYESNRGPRLSKNSVVVDDPNNTCKGMGLDSKECSCCLKHLITHKSQASNVEHPFEVWQRYAKYKELDDNMWRQLPNTTNIHSALHPLLQDYKVIGVDRTDRIKVLSDQQGCGNKRCRCLCSKCLRHRWREGKDGFGDPNSWIANTYTHLSNMLKDWAGYNNDKWYARINPWCLRRLWFCRDCYDYAIVQALTKEGKEYYVCLECKASMDCVGENENGNRIYANKQPC